MSGRDRARRRSAGVLGVGAAVALGLSGCGLSLQQMPKPGGLDEPTYSVTATFDDVLNLPASAEVRDGARVVGEVGEMRVDGYSAEVELRFLEDVEIPQGTTVEVRFDNPLGDQYVEVRRQSEGGPPLRDGDRIAVEDTAAAPTVEDTLGAFATVLTGGGIGDINTISRELNAVFSGNQVQVRQLLERLEKASELLAGGLGPIDRALRQAARLAEQLGEGDDVIAKGIEEISPAIGVLADLNDDFTTLLKGLDELGKAGNAVITRSGRQTVRALERLAPTMEEIVDARDLIGPVLRNLKVFAEQVPEVTRYGYARTSIVAQLDVSSTPSTASGTIRPRAAARSVMTPLGPVESGRQP